MNAAVVMLGAVALVVGGVFVAAPGDEPAPSAAAADDLHEAPVAVAACHGRVDREDGTNDAVAASAVSPVDGVDGDDDGDARLAAMVLTIDRGDDGLEQVRPLRDVLVARPSIAATFVALVRAPQRTERCRQRLLQALQLAGDAECQRALATVAIDDAALRERALRALGSVVVPTATTLDVLWTHATSDRGSVGLAAFARAAASAGIADATLQRRACDRLRAELNRAVDPDSVRALLRALAAAGDPHAADAAAPFATAADVGVRRAAVQMLVASREPGHELVVHDLLAVETDAEVRRIVQRGRTALAAQ